MGEIITQNNTLSEETQNRIRNYEKFLKNITVAYDELKKQILEEMTAKNIIKLENENIIISNVLPSDRETFDTKAFRAEHEDLYDKYVKMSKTNGYLRIKVKENDKNEDK